MGRTRGVDRPESSTGEEESAAGEVPPGDPPLGSSTTPATENGSPAASAAGAPPAEASDPSPGPAAEPADERPDGDEPDVGYEDLRVTSVYEPSRAPVIRRIVLWLVLLALVAAAVVFQADWLPVAAEAIEDLTALFS